MSLCQSLFLTLTLLKKRLAQAFSSEFCEIFKNTLSHRTPPWFSLRREFSLDKFSVQIVLRHLFSSKQLNSQSL